ncbi:transmembrane protein 71 isoform X2 [Pangasianodon hypophthalmus]|uniref:transmembrane protein 71 isoform X2 n=1 Tax=Pangasianodon hypophthalmus TaxID=310915 RepID=UPI000EFE472F|nr:transmembrane protein 71 isoform X2 [Pangasianodon hypophthalmus]
MDIFFRGTITSSPIKTRNAQGCQPSYSFHTSFLSDASYECFSTNPETGLVHLCRRSPRLLANGYYVLTEDSVVTDDEGNLTLTPTQTNISYKENIARIFRRRRKTRRSFATLLNDVSQSLLSGSIFGRDGTLSSAELSSCLDVNSGTEQDTSVYFTYGPTEIVPLKDKESFLPEVESLCEDCSAPVLPAQSLNSLIDVPPESKCYCTPNNPPSDAMFRKAFLVLLFTLCLCANMFSRYVCGGIAVAMTFLFLISSICGSKSGTACTIWTKTEDITSRIE